MLTALRETKQKTLEEIAAAFGDRVVEVNDKERMAEAAALEGKATVLHVEEGPTA